MDQNKIVIANSERTGFSITTTAPRLTPHKYTESCVQLFESLASCFQDVFIPTGVEITPRIAPADSEGEELLDKRRKPPRSETIRLTGSPVHKHQILEKLSEIPSPEGHSIYPHKIKIVDTIGKFFLAQGDVEIDTNSPRYYYKNSANIENIRPDDPPWIASISPRSQHRFEESSSSQMVYNIYIYTYTHEYSNIQRGQTNRINASRLYRALRQFCTDLDDAEIRLSHDFPIVWENIVDNIFTGDDVGLPPEDFVDWPDTDAMIERYRSDWVEETLTDCQQVCENDTLVLECRCECTIPTTELKSRIEAFVRTQSANGNPSVDSLRVHQEDGSTLEATVSSSGLGWT